MRKRTSRRFLNLIVAGSFVVAGPLFAQGYLSALDSNKKVVFDFYRLVVEPRNADLIEVYVAPEFVNHDPSDEKGTASLEKMLKAMGPPASQDIGSTLKNPPAYIMAQGDLVIWLFKTTDPKDKSERYSLDAYRIKDRKIVEHWKGTANLP